MTIDTINQRPWNGIFSLTFDDGGTRIIVTTQAGPVAAVDGNVGVRSSHILPGNLGVMRNVAAVELSDPVR